MTQELATPIALAVSDLHVSFGKNSQMLQVLRGLSFELHAGQIGCLLGASGCGKTTVMRAIAGFVPPDQGLIELAQQPVSGPGLMVPPEQRRIGIVFQDYALFPHLNAIDNIAFGLRDLVAKDRLERAREMLDLVGLNGVSRRYPHELSGGQQQRIALARALAPQPHLILLDEPYSNLDPELREHLALEVRKMLKQTHTTALLVTHDQHEAFAMADTIGVLEQGQIAQWDTPYKLYHQPNSKSVADFVGQGSFLPGQVQSRDGNSCIAFEVGRQAISNRSDQAMAAAQADVDMKVDVLLRPDDIIHDDASPIKAIVVEKAFRGAMYMYTLRLPSGTEVLALVPSHHDHPIGEPIGIRFEADHVVTFPINE